jgi:hypothetical protein
MRSVPLRQAAAQLVLCSHRVVVHFAQVAVSLLALHARYSHYRSSNAAAREQHANATAAHAWQ